MRMSIRRFTRLKNTFSKKLENHAAAVALHYLRRGMKGRGEDADEHEQSTEDAPHGPAILLPALDRHRGAAGGRTRQV